MGKQKKHWQTAEKIARWLKMNPGKKLGNAYYCLQEIYVHEETYTDWKTWMNNEIGSLIKDHKFNIFFRSLVIINFGFCGSENVYRSPLVNINSLILILETANIQEDSLWINLISCYKDGVKHLSLTVVNSSHSFVKYQISLGAEN